LKKLKSFPYHLLLIAAFQILSLYAINVNKVDISVVLPILFLTVFVIFLLFLVVLLITRDLQQSGVIATFYCFLFFTYGRLYHNIFGLVIGGLLIGRNKYLLPIFVVFLIAGTFFVLRSQWFNRTLNRITYFLNVFGLGLVAISILMAVINFDWTLYGKKAELKVNNDSIITVAPATLTPKVSGLKKQPNVYFMIFDGYASPTVLRKYYGWNDHDLVDALRSRGFTVDENAFSNYPHTILSINSYLDMGYVHKESEFVNAKSKYVYLANLFKQNRVMSYFKSQGYNVEVINQGMYKTQKENITPYDRARSLFSNELMTGVIQVSFLCIIEYELLADSLRNTILSEMNTLSQVDVPSIPTFLYSHIICPHPPYIFREDGSKPNIYESAWGSKVNDRKLYIDQIRFIGRKIIEIVDKIKKRDPEAIIILRADHGHGNIVGNYLLNAEKPPLAFIEAQFGMLNATYLPVGISIPEKNMPVNLFRYLFNALFNAKLEILPDKAFFTHLEEPFDFHEVTNELIK
jgi:hypothetical protein